MSHYTVAVFSVKDGRDVGALLAPFDENIEVAPYVYKTREQIIEETKQRLYRDYNDKYAEFVNNPRKYEKELLPNQIERYNYIAKILPLVKSWSDQEIYDYYRKEYEDEDSFNERGDQMSTYNPKSKWDWYSVGGRWGGLLTFKNGQTGDSGYSKFVDFEKMRENEIRQLEPYKEYLEGSPFYSKEYLMSLYPDEETYRRKMTEFSTYAVITPDGEWHSKGEMGWFGISSETGDEDTAWCDNYYDNFIRPAIENNWYLTIVDCHI